MQNSLEYFGYANVECGTSYVDEVSGFTNINQLCPASHEDDIRGRMDNMLMNGIMPLISLQSILFDGSSLKNNFRRDFNRFARLNDFDNYYDLVSFYLYDEPYLNNVSYKDIETAASAVKKTLIDPLLFQIEAYTHVGEMEVPDEIDVIGFDMYGIVDPATDQRYIDVYNTFLSKMKPHQELCVIMEGQWLDVYDSFATPEVMLDMAVNYYNFAQAAKAKYLLCYTWAGNIDGPDHLGVRDLPLPVIEAHKAIGGDILNKNRLGKALRKLAGRHGINMNEEFVFKQDKGKRGNNINYIMILGRLLMEVD